MIIAFLGLFSYSAIAGIPIIGIGTNDNPNIAVAFNDTASITYNITNNTPETQNVVWSPVRGITQNFQKGNAKDCRRLTFLKPKASCDLHLIINASQYISNPKTSVPVMCNSHLIFN